MSNSPLVSVILPTYNRAEMLAKAIESVLSQTYQNWELIIWNDGSLDETEKVIQSYKDERIVSYYDSNHGMSYALNNAINKSHGEFVAFLDDDDQWTENKLSHQMDILLRYPEIDLVFGNFINIDLVTGEQGIGFDQYFFSMKKLEIENVGDGNFLITGNFINSICSSNFIAFDTAVIRRGIINQVGKFNENLRNSMDFEFWWRLALVGSKLAYTHEIVLNRIKPPASLSSPGLLTYQNKIKGLDACLQATLASGRKELVQYLNRPYSSTWQKLIPLYASIGDRKRMLDAFFQSMRYGFNLSAIRVLLNAIFSQKVRNYK